MVIKTLVTSSSLAPMAMALKKLPSFSATVWQMTRLAPLTFRVVTDAGSLRSMPAKVTSALVVVSLQGASLVSYG